MTHKNIKIKNKKIKKKRSGGEIIALEHIARLVL
jgi:hypothetical protein